MFGLFGGLGPTEIIVILLIVLLLFGAKRIPEVAQGMGKGLREFKKAARDIQKDIDQGSEEKPEEKKTEA
jgi:sec-independent protein translocase protein TatA